MNPAGRPPAPPVGCGRPDQPDQPDPLPRVGSRRDPRDGPVLAGGLACVSAGPSPEFQKPGPNVRVGRSSGADRGSRAGPARRSQPRACPSPAIGIVPPSCRPAVSLLLFVWLTLAAAGLPGPAAGAGAYPPPVRVVAVADVVELQHGTFAVHEFLDVYNDDFNRPLTVLAARAECWVGRRRDRMGENWLPGEVPQVVPPASVRRVAERQRIVTGRPRRNWWVRWLRFAVETDRGTFFTNFADSPLRPPGKLVSDTRDGEIDPWSSPPGHASAPAGPGGVWRSWPEGR